MLFDILFPKQNNSFFKNGTNLDTFNWIRQTHSSTHLILKSDGKTASFKKKKNYVKSCVFKYILDIVETVMYGEKVQHFGKYSYLLLAKSWMDSALMFVIYEAGKPLVWLDSHYLSRLTI